MAVVSIKELHQRRASSTTRTGRKSHTRVFQVVTNDKADGTAVAQDATITVGENSTSVPGPGDTYRGVPFASKTAAPIQDSATHFEVTVNYEAPSGSSQQPTGTDPLQEPPDISYGASEATEPYFLDCSDPPKPVTNTAGDPFETELQRDTGHTTITIVRNEADYHPAQADQYKHTVNADQVTIDGKTYAPGTLRLAPITAQKQIATISNGGNTTTTVYYRKTYSIKVNAAGWRHKPLDVGFNELLGDGTEANPHRLVPILSGAGIPVSKPYPLNGEGRRKPNPTDAAEVLEFLPYREVPWAPLNFA